MDLMLKMLLSFEIHIYSVLNINSWENVLKAGNMGL